MQLRYPRSFLKLIMIGFALVGVPLALALFTSAVSIDRLEKQSQRAVYQAAKFARVSRQMADDLTRMERSLRQYVVLGDPELLDGYHKSHLAFQSQVKDLEQSGLPPLLRGQLLKIAAREQAILDEVMRGLSSPASLEPAFEGFAELDVMSAELLDASDHLIVQETNSMRLMAEHARDIVSKQLLLLVPLASGLVLGFALMISRPIRQIEAAIRHMGEGNLLTAVEIEGPEDLRRLGERLDWLRTQLKQVEEQKTRFLQQVSHDLKTPLAALREGADLLADGTLGSLNAQQQEVSVILQQNSIKLQRLIENLLNFSALQAQAAKVTLTLAPLRPLVKRVLAGHQLAILNKNLKLDFICPRVTIEADTEKLRVIIDNLLSNALRFAPQGSTVRLHLAQRERALQIDVVDAGPGIAAGDRRRVFERFYQGAQPGHAAIASTGLGLAIVAEFVRVLRGTITIVDPVADGEGAHFRVVLPNEYWTDEQ